MKIVQYLARMRLEDGGVVRAVLDLAAALAARGHAVTLLTLDDRDVPAGWAARVERLPRPRGALPCLGRDGAAKARQAIATADAVHLHVPWDPRCAALARLCRRSHTPHVVSLHGMLDDWSMAQHGLKKRLYLAAVGRRFLERASAVHLTARAEREQSARWYPRGRPVVLPLLFESAPYLDLPGPGPARSAFPEAFGTGGEPVVLFVSRLHPKKRPDLLIDAAGLLREQGTACRLVIAGTGEAEYERRLREHVAQLGLEDRVSFVGFVSGTVKVSLYQAAAVSCLPTSQENWGFALIESLAAGTPVVTTRGVDIWFELQSAGGAVIVEQSPASIAAALRALLSEESRRRSLGERGRAWVLQELTADRVAERYESFYAGLGAAR